MPERSSKISDREARELWRRAIELQMAADRDASHPRQVAERSTAGLSMEQVLEAAEGAGIGPVHVRMAIAERRLPEADQLRADRWMARWHRRLLKGEEVMEVARPISAAPERTLAAFEAVVAKPAFRMILEDRVGRESPAEGVWVYRIESPSISSSFHGAMDVADARVVLVTADAVPGGTMLRLRVPKLAQGQNLALTTGISGGLGAGGGYGGATVGSAVAGALGTASLAVAAAPVALGALIGAGLGLAGCRGIYRWGARKGRTELQRLLRTVALEVEAGGGRSAEER